MACFGKTLIRIAVIGALAGGVALVLAGPHRMGALLSQGKVAVNSMIDRNIEDPVALRAQLRDLESQYPKRIARVQSDLAEVSQQVAELQREQAVARRVVELADADLTQVQGLLAQAEDARVSNAGHIIKVRLDNRSMDMDDAYARANQISQTRSAWAERANELDTELSYLTQQEQQLQDLAAQLENERAEFQSQLWQLDRQVDSIARNQRMITMMEQRQKAIDGQSRYEGISLDQVTKRLEQIRSAQQARLEALNRGQVWRDYEDRAEYELNRNSSDEGGSFIPDTIEIAPPVIEITPEEDSGQVASNGG
jgi:chromosome segregation ATPase